MSIIAVKFQGFGRGPDFTGREPALPLIHALSDVLFQK